VFEYPVPTTSSTPDGIAAGPDSTLWFTEGTAKVIGQLRASG
jgi:streptogramin lyase